MCEFGTIGSEDDYQGPIPYGYCEKCTCKGYLGYNCIDCKKDPVTGKFPKCIGYRIDLKKVGNKDQDKKDEDKDGHDDKVKDGNDK